MLSFINHFRLQIFYPIQDYVFDWVAVFRPFNFWVWITLLVWIFVGAFSFYFSSSMAHRYGLATSGDLGFVNSFLFMLQSLCSQGTKAQRTDFLTQYLPIPSWNQFETHVTLWLQPHILVPRQYFVAIPIYRK